MKDKWIERAKVIGRLVDIVGRLANIAVICISILFIISLFSGCKTCEPVEIVRDSIRVESRLDSVYVYQHDSVWRDRYVQGDTIYITNNKYITRYKDKVVLVHDTIANDVVKVEREKYVPSVYKWGLGVAIVLVICIVARIAWCVYRKIKTI